MTGARVAQPEIKVGTAGYSYPGPPPKGWAGVVYPESKGKKFDALEYYAQFFNTVEINTTFYRPPSPSMSRAWTRKVPADFQFSVKVWQKFTHARPVGADVGETKEKWEAPGEDDMDLFRNGIDPLAESGKLGVLLFQYPPSFHRSSENIKRLEWTLKSFRDYTKVVELRHRTWSDNAKETNELLSGLGTSWVLIDEPKFSSSVRQEFGPWGKVFYFRLHGRNAAKWWKHEDAWERYDYLYSPEEIRHFAGKIRKNMETSPGSKVYVFFNNHARGQAAANAIMMMHELGISLKPSPSDTLAKAFPQIAGMVPGSPQSSLF